jgi:phage head maturation protease
MEEERQATTLAKKRRTIEVAVVTFPILQAADVDKERKRRTKRNNSHKLTR